MVWQITLFLYLITLVFVSYVGVYLTYVAIPVILIFGVLSHFTSASVISETPLKEKSPEQELSEVKERIKKLESNNV